MNGFRFNGKHINEEFPALKIVSRSTPPPEEIPIKDSVLGMQGDYDFAIAIFGERLFKNRPLTYVFTGKEINEDKRSFDKTMLENWLLKGSYAPLYDDKYPLHYFMARCVNVDLESDDGIAKTRYTLTFDAYPFKIKESIEGSPYWDDYDVSDYYQENEFEINGTTTIQMMNTGAKGIAPEIVLSSQMTITKGNNQFILSAGKHTIEDLRFEIGMNTLNVIGNGTVKFIWHKEVI
ncbi:hypothetical protein ACQUEU_00730 [Enterococcus casseliflavus]|uniref:hypothetical protein n=1 Tax=Enterococcus casseliflavus TaxID=37734 RepID=UPI003D0ABB16